ncbi:choice-of-anchor J domain-containing protein, partial [Flavobacterium sp.]|uniref:choice-of-anchor J domain-containing protein n=1 Tax=Flavobacterium sp. TaxID=239 RepID=UPI003BECDB78
RTSRYANFAGFNTPKGSGKIRGVLTKYNSGFQLVLRTERDVKMGDTRPVNPALVFTGSLTEPFTSYSVGDKVFPKYINDQTVGGRYWAVKQFPTGTGNKYIEMSSYTGASTPGVVTKAYFMVPVDFTAANTFTFSKEIRYNSGVPFKVYYVQSSNYTPNGIINVNSFVDITSSFNIAYPAIGSSENSFTNAGTYAIPTGLTGTGFFVFEYSGTSTITTTIQIDDIKIN